MLFDSFINDIPVPVLGLYLIVTFKYLYLYLYLYLWLWYLQHLCYKQLTYSDVGRPTSISLIRSSHMSSFALLVVLASAKFWSFCYKTYSSECSIWLPPVAFSQLRVHQIRFRLGLCPGPCWGSLQCSPDSLAGLRGTETRRTDRQTDDIYCGMTALCVGLTSHGKNHSEVCTSIYFLQIQNLTCIVCTRPINAKH